jgi:hypothetical protein
VDAHGRSSAIDRYILLYQLIGERHSLKCICLDVDRVAAKREGQMIIKGCGRYQKRVGHHQGLRPLSELVEHHQGLRPLSEQLEHHQGLRPLSEQLGDHQGRRLRPLSD